MKKELVDMYLNYYSKSPPILDDHELKYFDCLFRSNEDLIRSCSIEELYGKYHLTRYLHYVVYRIHNPSHF